MKKIFCFVFVFALLFQNQAHAIDEWTKGQLSGSANASDIDAYNQTNNNSQDRLLVRYKRGLGVNYLSASTLSVLVGEVAIPNSDDSVIKYRRLSTAASVGWADIDTGAEASSTQYYVYAIGDTASTAPTFKISTSSSAPSGITYYLKIAQFYNDASGNISDVINYRNDNGADYHDVAKAWVNFNGSGVVAINNEFNVSSITDNGTGDYTVNFSTSFSSANYVVSGMSKRADDGSASYVGFYTSSPLSTSSARILTYNAAGSLADSNPVCVTFFGDQT